MTYVLLDGVDKLYYAKVTQDDAAAYAAETPVALAPMKTAVQTPKTSSKVDFYDNQPMFSMQAEGETEIKLDVTQLPLNVQADLLGKAYAGNTSALGRYGIVVDETIPKAEKFEAVLRQLEARFGGAAQAERARVGDVRAAVLVERPQRHRDRIHDRCRGRRPRGFACERGEGRA